MLAWLNEWLRSIIIIILLAAFVDLILPNRSMQRYVKVVVSLFVLMTILTPIVQMLVSDFNWEKFEFPNNPIDSIVASVAPLEQIEREGELIRTKHKQNALDIVTDQVEQMIAEQITELAGWPPQNVKAMIEQNEAGEAAIQQVVIELTKVPLDQSAPSSRNKSALIESVEAVQIDSVSAIELESEQTDNNRSTDEEEAVPVMERADMTKLEQEMIYALQREWGLAAKQIRIGYIDP